MLRTAAITSAPILAALALSACGGSSPNVRNRQTANAAGAGIAMARCMRANGVPNFPDPSASNGGSISVHSSGSGSTVTVNGVPVSSPAFQSAIQKCSKDLPHGPALSASQVDKLKAGALAMARCMRAHGVPNFPDPVVSAGPGGVGVRVRIGVAAGTGIDPSSPAFQAAQKTCQPLMGGPGFRTRAQ